MKYSVIELLLLSLGLRGCIQQPAGSHSPYISSHITLYRLYRPASQLGDGINHIHCSFFESGESCLDQPLRQ